MKQVANESTRISRLQTTLAGTEIISSRLRFGLIGAVVAAVGIISLSDFVGATYKRPIMGAKNLIGALVPGTSLSSGVPLDLPIGIDTIGHTAIWGCVGFIVSSLIVTQADRVNALSALWALSAAIEIAQKYFSFSRQAQLSDLVANGMGLALGGLAATIALAWAHRLVSESQKPIHPATTR